MSKNHRLTAAQKQDFVKEYEVNQLADMEDAWKAQEDYFLDLEYRGE